MTWRRMLPLLLTLTFTACASLGVVNQDFERLTRRAIDTSEQLHRSDCASPTCLTDAQFKEANVILNKIAVAGLAFTRVSIAAPNHLPTNDEAQTFLAVVAAETANLSRAFPGGTIGSIVGLMVEIEDMLMNLIRQ